MFKKVEKDVYVKGMHCAHCAKRIEDAFSKEKGVKVKVDFEKERVHLESKKELDDAFIKEKIEEAGYEVKE